MAEDSKFRKILLVVVFAVFAVIVFGLFWFFFLAPRATTDLGDFGWYVFSFAAGLSMIVLPCTLPLAFVIVPLSMGKGAAKGFAIAVAFGLGVAITLSLYGIVAAAVGKVAIGTIGAPLEVVKNWLYFVAGAFAYVFALGELGIVRFRMPTYSGALPGFIQKQQDVLKALLLGLFLGNIGVGCPHPATPVILTQIAASGDIYYGWLLFFVHAIGRILPLIFLAVLGILGINALQGLIKHKNKIESATGWAMVFVAGFILTLGLFSHDWWVLSGQHTYLEGLTQEQRFVGLIADRFNVFVPHEHGLPPADHTGLFGLPLAWGTWFLLLLWILPFFWYLRKKKKELSAVSDPIEKAVAERTLPQLFWNFVTLSILLVLIFGYVLPHRFLEKSQTHDMEEMMGGEAATGMMHDGQGEGATHAQDSSLLLHEEGSVKEGLVSNFNFSPLKPQVGKKTKLEFFVNEKPTGNPVTDLEIGHEKYMHLIGVRDDLNEFFHIHPAPVLDSKGNAVSGRWSVEYIFSKPGVYKIWTDIMRGGAVHSFGHPAFTVEGFGERSTKAVNFGRNVIVGDNYQVALDDHGPLFKNAEADLHFTIKDLVGRPVDVEPYLGADMHLAIIKDDLKQYIHTHPEGGDHMHGAALVNRAFAHGGIDDEVPGAHDGVGKEIEFHVTLPEAGIYRAFAQFRPKGTDLAQDEYLLASFYLKVEDAKPAKGLSGWWVSLLVSIILIVVLARMIKKYITVPVEVVKK